MEKECKDLKKAENARILKNAYMNYVSIKSSVSHLDCQLRSQKEEPKDGKRD